MLQIKFTLYREFLLTNDRINRSKFTQTLGWSHLIQFTHSSREPVTRTKRCYKTIDFQRSSRTNDWISVIPKWCACPHKSNMALLWFVTGVFIRVELNEIASNTQTKRMCELIINIHAADNTSLLNVISFDTNNDRSSLFGLNPLWISWKIH